MGKYKLLVFEVDADGEKQLAVVPLGGSRTVEDAKRDARWQVDVMGWELRSLNFGKDDRLIAYVTRRGGVKKEEKTVVAKPRKFGEPRS